MREDEFFDGYDGGGELPTDAVRADLVAPKLVARTYLDKQLVRLMTLNPHLKLRFRNDNLANLDEATKRQILEDMRYALGIDSPAHEESLR